MREIMFILAAAFGGLAIFAFATMRGDIQLFGGLNAVGFAIVLCALAVLIDRTAGRPPGPR